VSKSTAKARKAKGRTAIDGSIGFIVYGAIPIK
jgi:hypothetical protein